MQDKHTFSPTLIFCPHEDVAAAWHTLEYGLGAHPPWARITGWVGPTPDEFFLAEENPSLIKARHENRDVKQRIVTHVRDAKNAKSLYNAIMNRIDMDVSRLGHLATEDQFRVLFILEADSDGLMLSDEERDQYLQSIKNFLHCPKILDHLYFQGAFILLQDGVISQSTINLIEEINTLLTQPIGGRRPRCESSGLGANPPKVFLASCSDENGRPTDMGELQFMAASLTHLLCEQSRWPKHFLHRQGWIDGKIYPTIFGLRAFFWERIRAVDISRKKHYKAKFVRKWLDDGWHPRGTFSELPDVGCAKEGLENEDNPEDDPVVDKWGKLHSEWTRELWKNLQALKKEGGDGDGDLEAVQTSKDIEAYRGKLQKLVLENMSKGLSKELARARDRVDDPKSESRAVRRILNIISRIADHGVTEKFKLLDDAACGVREGFSKDFEHYHQERVHSGTGLKLLMGHYRNLAATIESQAVEYSREKKNKSFKTTEIMTRAMRAIVAQLERPHDETLKVCWSILFGFLTIGFFSLFEMLKLADTFISSFFGITAVVAGIYAWAIKKHHGKARDALAGPGWLFLGLMPLFGYGFFYWLQHAELGRYAVHMITGTSAALCFSLGIVGYHISSTTVHCDKEKKDFTMEVRSMVEAMVNHRMVSVTTNVMHHARELLLSRADELETQIKVAEEAMEFFSNSKDEHPKQPEDMEFISMLNPAMDALTRSSWEKQIEKDTEKWAKEFWKGELPPKKLENSESWWRAHLKKYSDISHRNYLIKQNEKSGDHQLDGDVEDVGLRLWQNEKTERFSKLPVQARIQKHATVSDNSQYRASEVWLFHPSGKIAEDQDEGIISHINDELLRNQETLHTVEGLYNTSVVCMLKLEHGYAWDSIQSE